MDAAYLSRSGEVRTKVFSPCDFRQQITLPRSPDLSSAQNGSARLRRSNLLLIFDLDGTLIDSSQDLAISTNATRAHMGLPPLDPNLIFSYVGNGAPVLVRRALGPEASEEAVAEALAYFLKFYRVHALEHTKL